ncbi:hypothetical protein FRC03_008488 [Tulasnella sp. 419]|nr:hypothetical protein FRC03_008488 [Tulasnella sp. 419]
MFVMTFVTTMIWVFAPPSLIKLAISPTLAISNISGCRIILNLRALNQKDPDDFHLQSIGVTECRDGLGGQEELQPVARTMSFGGRIPCINSSMENGMIEPEVSRHVHLTHPHSTTESHEDARGGRE